jgi:Ca-activated chloride channel homolog
MRASRAITAGIVTLSMLIGSALLVAQTPGSNPNGPVVTLSLIVTDRSNHSIDDTRKEDIKVFEDKVEQSVLSFEKDERPIDYAIAIDSSGSLRSVMAPAIEAVGAIISHNRAGDQTFIERFVSSDKVNTLQDFTGDQSLLLAALRKVRVEQGQSAVLDGLHMAIDHTAKHAQKGRRQAVFMITDGEDRASYYKLADVVKLLRESQIQVFIIGIVFMLDDQDRLLTRKSPRDVAVNLLTTIAEESGGRVFLAKNIGELAKAVTEIAHDLHSQTLITYQPSNVTKTGYRKVEVKLVESSEKGKRRAIAPRGYFINTPGPDSKSKDKKSP